MIKSLDSLRGKLDSMKNSGLVKDVKKAEQKLSKIQSGISFESIGSGNKINSS